MNKDRTTNRRIAMTLLLIVKLLLKNIQVAVFCSEHSIGEPVWRVRVILTPLPELTGTPVSSNG
jgi:hypothetical protein